MIDEVAAGCGGQSSEEHGGKKSLPAALRLLFVMLLWRGPQRRRRSRLRLLPMLWATWSRCPVEAFLMGTDYADGFPLDGEGPVRSVTLSPFQIDRFPVTNEEFRAFVDATGYRTEAEVFGWSFVFWLHIPEERFEELVEDTVAAAQWWCKVPGAFWSQPEGPGSHVRDRGRHPVVHVSWNDAQAYAAWAAKSLPTEAQWEYAARGGLEQQLYPWGNELTPNGEHRCNVWQGQFPMEDTGEDGYAGSCPIDSFPPNGFGIYSVTGNVWEWCADWFRCRVSREGAAAGSGRPGTWPEQGDEGRIVSLPRLLLQSVPGCGADIEYAGQLCFEYRISLRKKRLRDAETLMLARDSRVEVTWRAA